MQTIAIDKVLIPQNRQRQEFDEAKILELAESIGATALIHPPVLRKVAAGWELVAGERRLRAITMLALMGRSYYCGGVAIEVGQLAFTPIHSLSMREIFQVELDENLHRADLSWQERALALTKLHELRTAVDGVEAKLPMDITRKELIETAKQVLPEATPEYGAQILKQSVILSKHLDDPDVAKAASPKDAMKILQRKFDKARNTELGLAMAQIDPTAHMRLLHGDAQAVLAELADSLFDVVLTDPPYGMGADSFGDGGGKMVGIEHQYKDSSEHLEDMLLWLIPELTRVTRAEAHLYMYCDIDQFSNLRLHFSRAGWWVHRTPLIHLKREGGRVPWPQNGPRRAWEMVLYAVKGKKTVNNIVVDVFDTTLSEKTWGHGAQKPVEGYVNLLQRSCKPGDLVLDPFAGTGTIFEAAHQLQLRATGIELDPANVGICSQRIAALK